MSAPDLAPDTFVQLSKDYAEILPVAEAAREVRRLRAELEVLDEMLADPSPDIREMAQEELAELEAQLPAGRARAGAEAAAARRRRRARRRCSKSAPAPAATRRLCSPATCCACTSAMPRPRAGGSR